MKLACIVGARPNFMKIAPILRAMEAYSELRPVLIHTGQHYDQQLSDVFFEELGIRRPDISLNVGSGSHAKQTADVMVALENVFLDAASASDPYDRVIVVGDVNSTMAAAIAASKLFIPVAHVEAGLRSFDRTMPEEINRILTDSISDLLLVSEEAGVHNLLQEGHAQEKIHLVGNVMIDTLHTQVAAAKASSKLSDLGLAPQQYGVVTLHRPSNVDSREGLENLVRVLVEASEWFPLVFPVHPRTRQRMESFGLTSVLSNARSVKLLEPLGYNDFLCLTSQAKVVVTDSGGLQEETTALGVPCLTMRENTERPITVTEGTSTLIGSSPQELRRYLQQVVSGEYKKGRCPELWDGKAAMRIAAVIANRIS